MIGKNIYDYPPEKWGVIFIDCAEIQPHQPHVRAIRNYYLNLIQHLQNFKIHRVVNSLARYCYNNQDRSMTNSMQYSELAKSIIPNSEPSVIEPKIHQAFMNNDHSFFITNTVDFVHLNEEIFDHDVRNWYLAGQSWNMCVHESAMGLEQLHEISDLYGYNFFVDLNSFIKIDGTPVTDEDLAQDRFIWDFHVRFGWELRPKGPKWF